MSTILFANGAVGALQLSALITDTTWHLVTGQGARFPNPQPGEYFVLTCQFGSDVEVVHVTARVADALTVVRARENTVALSWLAGAVVDLRVTAGMLEAFLQYAAGVSLALSGVTLANSTDSITGGTLQDNLIRGAEIKLSTLFIGEVKPADGNTAKSLRLPNGGGNPTIGAPDANGYSEILTQTKINESHLRVRNAAPTLLLRDTDGFGAAPHANLNQFYILRLGVDNETFTPFANGFQPMNIDLTTGVVTFGGPVAFPGWTFTADGNANSAAFGWLSDKFAAVQNQAYIDANAHTDAMIDQRRAVDAVLQQQINNIWAQLGSTPPFIDPNGN